MTLPVVLRREARAEFDKAFDWYEHQRDGLGVEFADEVQAVFDRISGMPEIHAVVYERIRKAAVKRFPYSVFYRMEPTRILVVAVFHTKRNPRIWKSRA